MKKFLGVLLAVLMLVSMTTVVIPAGAENTTEPVAVTATEVAAVVAIVYDANGDPCYKASGDTLADVLDTIDMFSAFGVASAAIKVNESHTMDTMAVVNIPVTLDLNGKTISDSTSWSNSNGNDSVIAVLYGGNLTITDSSADKTGAVVADTAYSAVKMTVSGDDITKGTATLTVENGTLQGTYYGITGNGSRHGTAITVNGGNIVAVGASTTLTGYPEGAMVGDGIFNPQNGTVTVNGGTISGPTGIEMRAGTLVVTDGTIKSTVTNKADFTAVANGSGNTVYGAAIALSQHNTSLPTSVEVTGGTLTGIKAFYQTNLKTDGSASTDISATIGASVTLDGEVEAAEEGFEMTANNGVYTLEEVEVVYVAEVNGTKYETFEAALEAAKNGEVKTIVLLSTIVLDEDTTLDLTGLTVKTATTEAGTYIDAFTILANVTVTGGTVDARPSNSYAFYIGDKNSNAGNLTIEDGTFYGATTVAQVTTGSLTINGGYFEATAYEGAYTYTLNCWDTNYKNNTATITVNGGTFYNFNPADNAAEGASTDFAAEGYVGVNNGNGTYGVEKEEEENPMADGVVVQLTSVRNFADKQNYSRIAYIGGLSSEEISTNKFVSTGVEVRVNGGEWEDFEQTPWVKYVIAGETTYSATTFGDDHAVHYLMLVFKESEYKGKPVEFRAYGTVYETAEKIYLGDIVSATIQ